MDPNGLRHPEYLSEVPVLALASGPGNLGSRLFSICSSGGVDWAAIIPESGAFRAAEGYRDAGMANVSCDFCGFGRT